MPAMTANASANVKNRVHEIRLMATAGEQVTANFRGALSSGETLTSALWESDDQTALGIVSGTVSATGSRVVISCPRAGHTYLRCQVVTTGGRTLNQVFYIMVSGGVFEDGAQSGASRIVLVVV